MKNLKPLKQGTLDGLCSIYATLNAIRLVLKEDPVSHDNYERAIEIFAWAFTKAEGNLDVLLRGADISMPLSYLRVLRKRLPGFDYALMNKGQSISELLRKGPVIIGIVGLERHWTVISSEDDIYYYLFDSSSYKKVKKTDVIFDEINEDKISILYKDVISVFPV